MQNFQPIKNIPFIRNKVTSVDLHAGSFNTAMYLEFRALFKLPDGGTPPSVPNFFASIAQMIRELKITVDGVDAIRLSGYELTALAIADLGRVPSLFPNVMEEAGAQNFILPINFYNTNSNNPHFTGLDLRDIRGRILKAKLEITWADENAIFSRLGDWEIENLEVNIQQQAVHNYRRKIRDRRDDGTIRFVNPARRLISKTERVYTTSAPSVELGRVVVPTTGRPTFTKGIILFANSVGTQRARAGALGGDITITQGANTILRVPISVLHANTETRNGHTVNRNIIHLPFSSLLQNEESERIDRYRDDLIITGQVNVNSEIDVDGVRVTVMSDSYTQEEFR